MQCIAILNGPYKPWGTKHMHAFLILQQFHVFDIVLSGDNLQNPSPLLHLSSFLFLHSMFSVDNANVSDLSCTIFKMHGLHRQGGGGGLRKIGQPL